MCIRDRFSNSCCHPNFLQQPANIKHQLAPITVRNCVLDFLYHIFLLVDFVLGKVKDRDPVHGLLSDVGELFVELLREVGSDLRRC
eukprot:TRINITY_DN3510_c0_g4_i1.p2 TRINITY_DN3510_c0_g4~~TRINITY_DN3510_c0_g4_i1.p2  ORF type:complete len:101 (-),score=3.65 TRINITY_DN3510_c0_g4_i1:127-384(-)